MTIRDVSGKSSSNSLTGVETESAQLPEIPTKNSASKGQFQTTKDVMENAKAPNSVDQMFQPGPGQIPYGQSFPGSQVQFFGFGGPGIALGYASLNDEQSKAFSQMEKSPGWDSLREYQRMQIRKNFSKVNGDKLQNELTKTQEKLGSIQTLKAHNGWKDLGEEQQLKISDQILKSPGTNLPQETSDFQKKLDSVQTLKGHNAWKTLDPTQQKQVSEQIFKSPPTKLGQETTDLQKKFDAIQTLSGHNAWKKLEPAQQQKVSDQMLKSPVAKLPQETADFQKKLDSVEIVAGHNSWKELTPVQKGKVEDGILKSPVSKLPQETTDIQKRFDSIQDVSSHNAWKELVPDQKQKVSDQLLKLSGTQLKQQTDKLKKDFDSIEKMAQHDTWKTLSPDQKQKLSDPVMQLSGSRLKQHLDQTEKRFDVIKSSLISQPNWMKLVPEDQQKIAGHMLKVSDRNLAQTTDNMKGTVDMIGTLRANRVDPEKSLDKLISLETQSPASYKKMTAGFTAAQTQINAATDKLKTATNVKDMLNLTLDRGVGDRDRKEYESKPEIFNRFVKQHATNPADFEAFRTAIKDTPAKLLVHWAHPDKVGVEFGGGAAISDTALNKVFRDKSIPAGDQSKYKHGLNILTMVEGRLDNVNAWDTGVMSLGIKQWTTHQGSLAGPLKEFETANPAKFRELLPGVTISGDEVKFNGKSLKEGPGRTSKDIVGNLTQTEIMNLSKMLNAVGKDPDFQAIQLSKSIDGIKNIENMRIGTNTISSYITSDRSLGHLVDYDPNRPAWVQPSFREAVENTAKEFGLTAAAPSRQELLDALKDKVEKDPDFQKKIKDQGGDALLNKLKTDAGRATFLENRLLDGFREQFIARETDSDHQAGLRGRWRKTDEYYNRH